MPCTSLAKRLRFNRCTNTPRPRVAATSAWLCLAQKSLCSSGSIYCRKQQVLFRNSLWPALGQYVEVWLAIWLSVKEQINSLQITQHWIRLIVITYYERRRSLVCCFKTLRSWIFDFVMFLCVYLSAKIFLRSRFPFRTNRRIANFRYRFLVMHISSTFSSSISYHTIDFWIRGSVGFRTSSVDARSIIVSIFLVRRFSLRNTGFFRGSEIFCCI
jgi:hypothetical protein